MKQQLFKLNLTFLSILIILCSYAQQKDVIFFEDFSDNGFNNWTPDGDGTANWAAIPTTYAGGEAPEGSIFGSPPFTGTARLISPIINTLGYTELNLSFLHFINVGAGGYWLSVETTSDGGTTWNEVWIVNVETGSVNVTEMITTIMNTPDVGSENLQFCFKFEENSALMAGWVFDNVTLTENQILNDVAPTTILGLEESIYENDIVDISALVINYGANAASFDVKLEISDESSVVFESTKTVTDLISGEDIQVDFDSWTAIFGFNYIATVKTLLAGDENPDNDEINYLFNVFPEGWYCIPSADCNYGDGLTDFVFAGIENYESGCSNNGYGVFTDLTASVTAGETYVATMTTDWETQKASIWVDFNLDFEFTSDELILTDYVLNAPGVPTEVDLMIPVDAITAVTTMRIGVNFTDNSSPDACADFLYGEWEDYSIDITGISGTNEVTFYVTEPGGGNYGGAVIDFYAMTGTTNSQGEYTFEGIATGTFPYTITIEDGYYYDVQGEVEVVDQSTTVNIELLLNTNVTKKMVTIEEWTGTWCYDCPAAANGLEEIVEAGYDVGIVAYHNSDAYSTGNDVPRMQEFYGRSWLPSVAFDAIFAPNCDGGASESCFDIYEPFVLEQMDVTSPFEVSIIDGSLNGNDLSATVTVSMPGFTYSEDIRLLVAITESDIEESWQGLTHLNFVERGMYPDYNGTDINLSQNEEIEVEVNFTLDASWVTGNMELIAFVQDFETKEIFNGDNSPILTIGIQENNLTDEFDIYPNPATELINISSAVKMNSIKVFNYSGQEIFNSTANDYSCKLEISTFEKGLYLIRIETNDTVYTRRVIVQ